MEKLKNFLKIQNEDIAADDHRAIMEQELSEIQNSSEFTTELQKYKALGNKIRLSIYKFLTKRNLCACELSVLFGKNEATISHHLKILTDAGLIDSKNKGYYVIYDRKNV